MRHTAEVISQISRLIAPFEPRTTALPEMATAVLILGEERDVEYVNASARALFSPLEAIGCDMPALLASCGATGGEGIFDSAADDDRICRIRLADERLLDCTMRQLSGGGYVLSLDDVTAYVITAEQAKRDPLTGLPNRKAFLDGLSEQITAAGNGGAFALLLIDLDRFKAVNDSLGHPIGDILLRKVAGRLQSVLRKGGVAARLGGDEFAIIDTAGPQPQSAQMLAERLVDLVGRTYVLEGHSLHIGASIGIAMFPDHGTDVDTLVKNADVALYRAKARGRGVHQVFEMGMHDRIQARRSMETDLRRALALKELHLVFQPQLDLATETIVGFEALMRWHHPTRGDVPPSEFIPLAEEIGVILPMTDWALRSACHVAKGWADDVTIAVNLSPVHFRGGRLLESVTSALAHSGLKAERLHLEITEGALLESSDAVLQTVSGLRSLGTRVCMDDFGTGYSSLGYLQRFPFDKIKIDRSFVQAIDRKPERLAILGAIVTMANALGMKTTAEGVETEAELACVRSVGCTQVQGFITGRPMSADDASALLRLPNNGQTKDISP